MTVATVAQTSATLGYTPTLGSVSKIALSFTTTSHNIAANGNVSAGVANSAAPTVTQLNLGNRPANDRALGGWLRRVRYWPRVLSNTELQQVTI